MNIWVNKVQRFHMAVPLKGQAVVPLILALFFCWIIKPNGYQWKCVLIYNNTCSSIHSMHIYELNHVYIMETKAGYNRDR